MYFFKKKLNILFFYKTTLLFFLFYLCSIFNCFPSTRSSDSDDSESLEQQLLKLPDIESSEDEDDEEDFAEECLFCPTPKKKSQIRCIVFNETPDKRQKIDFSGNDGIYAFNILKNQSSLAWQIETHLPEIPTAGHRLIQCEDKVEQFRTLTMRNLITLKRGNYSTTYPATARSIDPLRLMINTDFLIKVIKVGATFAKLSINSKTLEKKLSIIVLAKASEFNYTGQFSERESTKKDLWVVVEYNLPTDYQADENKIALETIAMVLMQEEEPQELQHHDNIIEAITPLTKIHGYIENYRFKLCCNKEQLMMAQTHLEQLLSQI